MLQVKRSIEIIAEHEKESRDYLEKQMLTLESTISTLNSELAGRQQRENENKEKYAEVGRYSNLTNYASNKNK